MKKINVKFVALQGLILFAIALIAGLWLGLKSVNPVANIIGFTIFFDIMLSMFYWIAIGRMITDKIATKTERKYSAQRGYSNCETFYSNSEIFKVNVEKVKLLILQTRIHSNFRKSVRRN